MSEDWGYPRFARDFPDDPELATLVSAFARGDYRTVREGAAKLEGKPDDVKRAGERLVLATTPDPTAKLLFVMTGGLLVFLTAWWVLHDGPPEAKPTPPIPTVERPK